MLKIFKDLYSHRELILILVQRNIKIRYKNSVLGFLWTLLGPIFLICIYAFFLHLMKVQMPLPSLVTGIITWQFLAMCMGDSLYAIIGNANLVTKASFPRIILPASMVLANTVNFILSLVVLVIYLLIVNVTFGPLILLPVIVVTHLALCMGMALIISSLNVFFRDTEHVLGTVMLAWFFLSPVIYEAAYAMPHAVELLGPNACYLLFLNPMTGILTSYRAVFISSDIAGIHLVGMSFAVSWLLFFIGVSFFQRAQHRFGDEL